MAPDPFKGEETGPGAMSHANMGRRGRAKTQKGISEAQRLRRVGCLYAAFAKAKEEPSHHVSYAKTRDRHIVAMHSLRARRIVFRGGIGRSSPYLLLSLSPETCRLKIKILLLGE